MFVTKTKNPKIKLVVSHCLRKLLAIDIVIIPQNTTEMAGAFILISLELTKIVKLSFYISHLATTPVNVYRYWFLSDCKEIRTTTMKINERSTI